MKGVCTSSDLSLFSWLSSVQLSEFSLKENKEDREEDSELVGNCNVRHVGTGEPHPTKVSNWWQKSIFLFYVSYRYIPCHNV